MSDGDYLLGTNSRERVRLGFQHRVWSEQACALWRRAGFSLGQTIADVGCGPGYASLDLAELVGSDGRIIAMDASERYTEHLRGQAAVRGLPHVEVRRCDVQRLDLDASTIHGAFARWVLCYLEDPESVVERVSLALKPGGAFAVQDYFNYRSLTLSPRSEALDCVVAAIAQSWQARGGDIDVAGRLPTMMRRCGLDIHDVRPIVRVARPGTALWEWPATFFMSFVPTLVNGEFLTQEQADAFFDDWRERSSNPDAFFLTPPVLEVLGVKR